MSKDILRESLSLKIRPRRNRKSKSVRAILRSHFLQPEDFVWPVFIKEGEGQREEIQGMPGCYRLSGDVLLKELAPLYERGLRAVALFSVLPEFLKDPQASESFNPKGVLQQNIALLKEKMPELCLVSDVAMDPYSSEGHDGLVENGEIVNDKTLPILAKMAVSQARAGVDYVAPSDMMDGRVGFIRKALDENGFSEVGIISYAVKYASSFYGPFRSALNSNPQSGDKKTYQMDVGGSVREALREVALDIEEGADIIMVKPALSYLDILKTVRRKFQVPVAAYNVSGEYSMVKAAHERGFLDERQVVIETLVSMKRAGADLIFSYWTPQVFRWLFDLKPSE